MLNVNAIFAKCSVLKELKNIIKYFKVLVKSFWHSIVLVEHYCGKVKLKLQLLIFLSLNFLVCFFNQFYEGNVTKSSFGQ